MGVFKQAKGRLDGGAGGRRRRGRPAARTRDPALGGRYRLIAVRSPQEGSAEVRHVLGRTSAGPDHAAGS